MSGTFAKTLRPVGVVALTLGACVAVFWVAYTHDPTRSAFMQLGIMLAVTASLVIAWRMADPGIPRHLITVLAFVWVLCGALGFYGAADSFLHPSQAVGIANPTEGHAGNDLLTWLAMLGFAGYGAAAVAVFLAVRAIWVRLRTARHHRRRPAT